MKQGLLYDYFLKCIFEKKKIKILLSTDLEPDDELGIKGVLKACAELIQNLNYEDDVEISFLVGEGDPDIQVFRAHKLLEVLKKDYELPDSLKIKILRGFSSNKPLFPAAGFEFIEQEQVSAQESRRELSQCAQDNQILNAEERARLNELLDKTESNMSLSAEEFDERDTFLNRIFIRRELSKSEYGGIPLNESLEQKKHRQEESDNGLMTALTTYCQEGVLYLGLKPSREALKMVAKNPDIFQNSEYASTHGFNTRTLVEEAQKIASEEAKSLRLDKEETDIIVKKATAEIIEKIFDLLQGFSKRSFFESGPSLGEDSKTSNKIITEKTHPAVYSVMQSNKYFGKVILFLISTWNEHVIKADRKIILDFARDKGLSQSDITDIEKQLRSTTFTREIGQRIYDLLLPDGIKTQQDKTLAASWERKMAKLLSIIPEPMQFIQVDCAFTSTLYSESSPFQTHDFYLTMKDIASVLTLEKPSTPHAMVSAYLPNDLDPNDYVAYANIPKEQREKIRESGYKLASPASDATNALVKRVDLCYIKNKNTLEASFIESLSPIDTRDLLKCLR